MNIIGYVQTYGDTPFSERPLNEVDSLVFSELSYLNYSGIVRYTSPKFKLGELSSEEYISRLTEDTFFPKSNRKLLEAVALSRRFGGVKVGYFRERNDESREIRFAAMTFFWEGGAYVCYRGTDVTILGWKEDFNMAFRTRIPSQKIAEEYLLDVASKTDVPLVVGGHSKGGNLTLYACINAPAEVRERITDIYNHDGPGFRESVFETEGYKAIADRVHKTIPHDSLIGILLHHSDSYKVVLSRSVLIGQHNAFAWGVEDEKSFTELPETTGNSKLMDTTLRNWIDGMNDSERRKFVNALFTVIEGSGAKKVPEFTTDGLRKLRGMREAFRSLPDDEKEMMRTGGKDLMKIWVRSLFRIRDDRD